MNANLVNVLAWTNPIKSAVYLILLNVFLLRFLFNQRPICGAAVILLICFLRQQWKHRFRPEVLMDPPDCEDWVNLTAYDLEKSLMDFVKTVVKTWISLRTDHYLMWVVVSSVFWISLAKFATLISFPTMLFVLSNGGFIAVPLLKNHRFEFFPSPGDEGTPTEPKTTNKFPTDLNLQSSQQQTVIPTFQPDLSSTSNSSTLTNASVNMNKDSDEEDGGSSLFVQSQLRERSATPGEPESLTPYGASIPSHEDSSEDEFLFDPKHFDSNSSSTSNSFEHLHF